MCLGVRRLSGGRILVAYNANCAHEFGILLLVPISLHLSASIDLLRLVFHCRNGRLTIGGKVLKGCQQAGTNDATSHWASTTVPA